MGGLQFGVNFPNNGFIEIVAGPATITLTLEDVGRIARHILTHGEPTKDVVIVDGGLKGFVPPQASDAGANDKLYQLRDWCERRTVDERVAANNAETAHQQAYHLTREALLREIVGKLS